MVYQRPGDWSEVNSVPIVEHKHQDIVRNTEVHLLHTQHTWFPEARSGGRVVVGEWGGGEVHLLYNPYTWFPVARRGVMTVVFSLLNTGIIARNIPLICSDTGSKRFILYEQMSNV